jgi:hypothetical protein
MYFFIVMNAFKRTGKLANPFEWRPKLSYRIIPAIMYCPALSATGGLATRAGFSNCGGLTDKTR